MIPNNIPYLIGETAFHHEGDIEFLKTLIKHGAEIGVNAMKFHGLLDLDDYMVANHDAIEVIRPWCLTEEALGEVVGYTQQLELEVVLLCNDVKSIDWAIQHSNQIKAIELHATGLNDIFLLQKGSQFDGTVILGVGGSTLDEIQYAIDFLRSNGQEDIFLMHGFQNYPTDFKDINLSKMRLLQNLFDLPIGYADHTDPADEDNASISVMGAALGFNVLEKHFTHLFGKKRIDAQAAVSLDQMKNTRSLLDKVMLAFGKNDLTMSEAEKRYGDTGPMKKAIVARELIPKGTIISLDNIAFKRTNESTYLKQNQVHSLIGLMATSDISKDELIDFSKVEYSFKKADFSQFHNTKK
ncbi:N-acetylneuraminate synthase family protein [Saprospiraceae bacterium]|nr:N-acetylneuraminate synthase family protein [Saprospiraceae bacterium]